MTVRSEMARKARRESVEVSLIDEYQSDPRGAVELAAAEAALHVAAMLQAADEKTDLKRSAVAERLGVGEARLSQIINSDGNIMLSTLAKTLKACGFDLQVSAVSENAGEPLLGEVRRKARGVYVSSREHYSQWSQHFISGKGVTRVLMEVPEEGEHCTAVPMGMPVHHSAVSATGTEGLYVVSEHRHLWATADA